MYKNRITEWGLDKRLKRDEVVRMYSLHRERFAAGKRSEFHIRERKVDWGSVQRFMKRRPQLRAQLNAGTLELEVGSAELGVVVRTPSPEPIEMRGVRVLLPMDAAPGLRLPEELVRITRDYCEGALDGGFWVRDEEDQGFFDGRGGYAEYLHLQKWYRPVWGILAMFRGGEVASAFEFLNALLDRLHSVTQMEGLYVMFYIWDMTDLFRAHDPRLADILVRHTTEVTRVVFGPRHPMRLMWERIEELPDEERTQAIYTTMRSVLGYMREHYGQLDINTLEIARLCVRKLGLYIRAADSQKEREAHLAEVEHLLGEVIDETDEENVLCDMFSRLALARLSVGKVAEAETALAKIERWAQDPENIGARCWVDVRWDYFIGRGDACALNGKFDEAAHYFREAVAHSREYRGAADPRTIEALEKIAQHYRAHGPAEEKERWDEAYREVCREALRETYEPPPIVIKQEPQDPESSATVSPATVC